MCEDIGVRKITQSLARRKAIQLWLLTLPAILLLLFLTTYPLLYTVALSFYSYNLSEEKGSFVGLANYADAIKDKEVLNSLKRSFIFVGVAVPLEVIAGFGIALLLHRKLRGISIFRSLLVIPMMVTPVVIGLTSRALFSPEWGLINYAISLVGLKGPLWLGNRFFAMLAVICVDFWQFTPFVALIFLAGLTSISPTYDEVAAVDGAKYLQRLRYITIPLLRPVFVVILLFRITDAFKVFDTIYMLTKGGPGNATETLVFHIFKRGFNFLDIGYASTLSVIATIIVGIVGIYLINQLLRRD